MDQTDDLPLAKRLVEDHKEKAAALLARFFNTDEKIREEVFRYLMLNSNNGQGGVGQSSHGPPLVSLVDVPRTLPHAPVGPASSHYAGSPPIARRGPRYEHPADQRSNPLSPPRPPSPPETGSSLGSRSARGESSTRQYILVPYYTGVEVKEKIFRMNTAPIRHSVIREDIVSRLGIDVDQEEGFVYLPNLANPNSWTPVRTDTSVTLDWRRPKSQATHSTTFLLVRKDLLDTDVLLGFGDSGEIQPGVHTASLHR